MVHLNLEVGGDVFSQNSPDPGETLFGHLFFKRCFSCFQDIHFPVVKTGKLLVKLGDIDYKRNQTHFKSESNMICKGNAGGLFNEYRPHFHVADRLVLCVNEDYQTCVSKFNPRSDYHLASQNRVTHPTLNMWPLLQDPPSMMGMDDVQMAIFH